jgi:hypothetical protein
MDAQDGQGVNERGEESHSKRNGGDRRKTAGKKGSRAHQRFKSYAHALALGRLLMSSFPRLPDSLTLIDRDFEGLLMEDNLAHPYNRRKSFVVHIILQRLGLLADSMRCRSCGINRRAP